MDHAPDLYKYINSILSLIVWFKKLHFLFNSKHRLIIIFLSLIIGAAVALHSCSDSDDEAPVLDDDINGIWIDPNHGVGIISNYGWDVNIVKLLNSRLYGDTQLRGRILSRSGEIYDSILSLFRETGDLAYVYYMVSNGTVVPKEKISAIYENAYVGELTLDMQYDSFLTERPASLDLIGGIWGYTDGTYTITISIDAEGNIFGSDTDGCTYSGDTTISDPSINIYRVNFNISVCMSMPAGKGQAILMDTTTQNDTLLLAVTGKIAALSTKSFVKRLIRQ